MSIETGQVQSADYRMEDSAAESYDIGVRYGDQVQPDMVAMKLRDEVGMSIVGAPQYFESYPMPLTVAGLLGHNSICLRLSGSGAIYAWELREGGNNVDAGVSGHLTFNGAYRMLAAALRGYGLAFLPLEMTQPHVETGRLRKVMEDCCPSLPRLFTYYPSHRNSLARCGS